MRPRLAMDFYMEIDARVAEKFSIAATGRDREICGKLTDRIEDHLILNTYREVLASRRPRSCALSLRIDNDIPIGKGCGSSAAARLAGIALAVHFGRLRWTDAQIIGEASRREHHPDNASACWMGGLTIARMSAEAAAEVQVACVARKGSGRCCSPCPSRASPRRSPSRSPRAIFARRRGQRTYRIPCCCSPPSRRAATIFSPRPWKTAFISPIAPRSARCLPALEELKGKDGILGSGSQRCRPFSADLSRSPKLLYAKKLAALVAGHLARKSLTAELISTSITLRGAREFAM
jgi:hypothetical protein